MEKNINYKKINFKLILAGIIIFGMDLFVVLLRKNFSWDYIIWLICSAFLIYFATSRKFEKFVLQKINFIENSNLWDEFFGKFLSIFAIKIILDILGRFFSNYLFYINMTELLLMAAMAFLIGNYAYKLGNKKIYWIFGLLGFIWYGTFSILLGLLTILELNFEANNGDI